MTWVSLLLCLATIGLWVDSYWHYCAVTDSRSDATSGVASKVGGFYLFSYDAPSGGFGYQGWYSDLMYVSDPERFYGIVAQRWKPIRFVRLSSHFRELIIPHWVFVILFAIAPLIRFRAWRRHRCRAQAGVCTKCGYDLRATPDRCPECGTVR
jgi:hypothetical protein